MYSKKTRKIIHKIKFPSKSILLNWFDHLKNEGGVYFPETKLKSEETVESSEKLMKKVDKLIDTYNHHIKGRLRTTTQKKIEFGSNFSFKNKEEKVQSNDENIRVKNFEEKPTTTSLDKKKEVRDIAVLYYK